MLKSLCLFNMQRQDPRFLLTTSCYHTLQTEGKLRELCITAGIPCAFSHSGFSRKAHNRELALFLCLTVIGCTAVLFEGRLGTCSVCTEAPTPVISGSHLPLVYWQESILRLVGAKRQTTVCLCACAELVWGLKRGNIAT